MNQFDFTVTGNIISKKMTYKNSQTFISKNRTYNGLVYLLSGSMEITFNDGKTFTAKEDDIIIQREGDCYKLQAVGGNAEYVVVSYSVDNKQTVLELLGSNRIFSVSQRKKTRSLFEKVALESKSSSFLSKTLSRELVQEILCEIFRETHPQLSSLKHTPLESAKLYIEEFYDKEIKISELSKTHGYSPSRFRTVFKEEFKVSPVQYLTSVRIERAKEMLESGLFTIEEVALSCGFINVYYFSKVFKKETGLTPGKFIKKG